MEINGYRFATFHNKSFMVNRRIKKMTSNDTNQNLSCFKKSNKGMFTPQ